MIIMILIMIITMIIMIMVVIAMMITEHKNTRDSARPLGPRPRAY